MISTERSAFLGVLTLCIYATSLWMQPDGSLIFPFPLYPAFYLAICAIYFITAKSDKSRALVLISGVLSLLSAAFFWEIVLSLEDFVQFMDQLYVDLFYLGSCLSIYFWIIWKILRSEKSTLKFIFASLLCLLALLGLFYNNKLIASFALLLPCFFMNSFSLTKAQVSLILFLVFLELSEWFTYALNNF